MTPTGDERAPAGPMTVRRAERRDLLAIVRMLADDDLGRAREVAAEPLPDGYQRAFAAIDADPRHLLLVGEAGGEVIATLQLTLLPSLSYQGGTRAQVESVRVAGGLRGAGYGRQLMAWAIDYARREGCVLVQLSTNASRTDAQRFYRRLGFEASHVGMKIDLRPGHASGG